MKYKDRLIRKIFTYAYKRGYNQACDDIIKKIRGKDENNENRTDKRGLLESKGTK